MSIRVSYDNDLPNAHFIFMTPVMLRMKSRDRRSNEVLASTCRVIGDEQIALSMHIVF